MVAVSLVSVPFKIDFARGTIALLYKLSHILSAVVHEH